MLASAQDESISTAGAPRQYRFLGKLGAGGMADVFLGIQRGEEDFSRLVAIKRLQRAAPPTAAVDLLQRFADEARVVGVLNHPHIVKVYDLLLHGGNILISMEYVDGETLQTIMAETVKHRHHIPLPIIYRWIAEAAEALHYAHNATTLAGEPLRLIHRDIDMRNLMVDRCGYLKVIDFGVAQTISRYSARTEDHTFMGKISYAAPEIFLAPETMDHRADIYSLGLVFHALVTERKPFPSKRAECTGALVQQVIHQPLPSPTAINPALPPALDAVIARATHKDPAERFQSGEAFAEAVEAFARTHEGMATPQEVKRWYQVHFAEHIAARSEFVQRAMARARQVAGSTPLKEDEPTRDSLTPSLVFEAPDPEVTKEMVFYDCAANDDKATLVLRYSKLRRFRHSRLAATAAFGLLLLLGVAALWQAHEELETPPPTEPRPASKEARRPESSGLPEAPAINTVGVSVPASPGWSDASQTVSTHAGNTAIAPKLPNAPADSSGQHQPRQRTRRRKSPRTQRVGADADQGPLTTPAPPRDRRGVRILTNYGSQDVSDARATGPTGSPRHAPAPTIRLLESYEQ